MARRSKHGKASNLGSEVRLLLVDEALSERVVATHRHIGLSLLSSLISVHVARSEIER
jgi:hypothetical protein